MNRPTQQELILKELKLAGDSGLHPTYFIVNLHIFQYTARIHDVREFLGCSCHHDYRCMATEHIINKTMSDGTTWFYYKKTPGPDWEAMRQETMQKREQNIKNSNQLSFL